MVDIPGWGHALAKGTVERVELSSLPAVLALGFLVCLSPSLAAAQAAAEYGQAIAGIGANVTGLTKGISSAASAGKKADSMPVPESKVPSSLPAREDATAANLRMLEQRAGKDAAKLNLKSVPAKASVMIDGKPVGVTPLLLILAPGPYNVQMDGPRMESGKERVELRPLEKRDVEMRLSAPPLYPTHITLR